MSLKEKLIKAGLTVEEEKDFRVIYREIEASSLSRVWQHVSDKERPVLIISAFLNELTPSENLQRNHQLAGEVNGNGYGYFWAKGEWTSKETKRHYVDDVIFVVGGKKDNGKLKGLAKKWMKKWGQESAAFKPEGSDKGVALFPDGSTGPLSKKGDGSWHPRQIEESFTQLRDGNKFSFASIYTERGWAEKMSVSAREK